MNSGINLLKRLIREHIDVPPSVGSWEDYEGLVNNVAQDMADGITPDLSSLQSLDPHTKASLAGDDELKYMVRSIGPRNDVDYMDLWDVLMGAVQ